MAKTLLLTGIGGFIGSHTMEHILDNTDWNIVGIDSFRHKGLTDRITDSRYYELCKERVTIITHDLIAPISSIMVDSIGPVDYIINMASESHVDRSIENPVPFIRNNVDLTLNMLEYARLVKPEVFIQISTDEVYGPMHGKKAHPEWDTILPSNPYSASKAAQEAISIAYWRTYGVPLIITNTMNNYGERQDPEKYLPKIIRAVVKGDIVTVHGTPDDIGSRYWLHARNHADALLWIIKNVKPGLFPAWQQPGRFNVVGDKQINNLEMAQLVAKVINRPLRFILEDFHSTRPGHDPHYGLTGEFIKMLGWKPPVNLEDSLEKTILWYEANPKWLKL